jgi:hypothetical protein
LLIPDLYSWSTYPVDFIDLKRETMAVPVLAHILTIEYGYIQSNFAAIPGRYNKNRPHTGPAPGTGSNRW